MTDSASSKKLSFTGSCLCGAVHYEVNGKLREVINCHCSLCRKFHGHYGAYTAAAREDVMILDNEHKLAWYQSTGNQASRGFCSCCGSSLFWDLTSSPQLSISAGTLDQPTNLKTTVDIFISDKADYYELDERLRKYEQGL